MNLHNKKSLIINQLRDVLDPELGMNIVDVGLIYNIEITEQNTVIVIMTLTTPGCPLTEYFLSEIEVKLTDLNFIEDVQIEFVWTPPWHITMMDEAGKQRMFQSLG